jgi:hypothetical protein
VFERVKRFNTEGTENCGEKSEKAGAFTAETERKPGERSFGRLEAKAPPSG